MQELKMKLIIGYFQIFRTCKTR